MSNLDIDRICGNAGLAFFTTLAGTQIIGLGLNGALPALASAAITAGLAFFTEWNRECGGSITKAINKSMVF